MSIKLAVMLVVFLFSGGAVFSKSLGHLRVPAILAGVVALAMGGWFWRDVYEELVQSVTRSVTEEIVKQAEPTTPSEPISSRSEVDQDKSASIVPVSMSADIPSQEKKLTNTKLVDAQDGKHAQNEELSWTERSRMEEEAQRQQRLTWSQEDFYGHLPRWYYPQWNSELKQVILGEANSESAWKLQSSTEGLLSPYFHFGFQIIAKEYGCESANALLFVEGQRVPTEEQMWSAKPHLYIGTKPSVLFVSGCSDAAALCDQRVRRVKDYLENEFSYDWGGMESINREYSFWDAHGYNDSLPYDSADEEVSSAHLNNSLFVCFRSGD